MKNESNKEVKIIDENYAQRYYDSIQDMMSEGFQNISLNDDFAEQIKDILQNFLEFLKSKLLDNDEMPNQDFESQQNQQELQDYFQQLPNPNSSDFQEQMEQAISELLNQLLKNEQFQQQDGQQQNGQQQNGQQQDGQQQNGQQQDGQQQDGQQQNGQQQDGQQQNGQQQNENIQKAMQSLVDKSSTSVKEVDENFENSSGNEQNSQEQQYNMNMDIQQQDGQQQNGQQQDGQQQDGQQQNGQQQDGQQQNGQQQNENIQKAMQSLVDKSNSNNGEGQQDGQQQESQQEDGQPNLDEETPITATYSDSDELTKLNVDWSDETVPRRRTERSRNFEQTKTEDELLKLFLKYLVKTNYYVKTYGLDKKNRRQIAKHFLLGLEHKIMTDTYSDVTEPLSFYIDMKGQCSQLSNYNDFFRRLLNEKEVSVYFGYGGKVVKYLRVKKPNANLDFDRCDMCHYFQNSNMLPVEEDIGDYYESRIFNEQLPLEEFVRGHRLTRLIAFSDFDAAVSIIKSSTLAKIYWFCTASSRGDISYSNYSLMDFKGEFIIARDLSDVAKYFEHINEPNYEINQRKLQLCRR